MVDSCFVEVIMEYESGKAIPNNQLLAKMERALGMYLIRTLYLTVFFCFFYYYIKIKEKGKCEERKGMEGEGKGKARQGKREKKGRVKRRE